MFNGRFKSGNVKRRSAIIKRVFGVCNTRLKIHSGYGTLRKVAHLHLHCPSSNGTKSTLLLGIFLHSFLDSDGMGGIRTV